VECEVYVDHLRHSKFAGLREDKARTVMVIKRSMGAGFAGIENLLHYWTKR